MDRCGKAVSLIGRADGNDLADHVAGRVLLGCPVADGAYQAMRSGGELGARAHHRGGSGLPQNPARRLEGLSAIVGAPEVESRVRDAGAPSDVNIAPGRGRPGASGQPGVIAISSLHEGHRRSEAAPAVVGPPDVYRAGGVGVGGVDVGAVTGTRGADIAAALPIECDGHVVAGRAGRRLRWQAAVLPARASVEREVGRDELRRRGRALAGDEELAGVPGVRRDRRPDMVPVAVVTDANVRTDARRRFYRRRGCRAVAGGKRRHGRGGCSAAEQAAPGDPR